MTANSFSLNQTATQKPHDLEFCPGIPNSHFKNLNSSVPYLVNAAFNAPLAIATTFANVVVLLAMRHVTSIRLPSKLLLYSLVLTDLTAGIAVQPQFAVFLFRKAIYPGLVQCPLYKSSLFTGSVVSFASLLTLISISVDRYAALFFHLKYQQIVTSRRVPAVLTFIWSISSFFASTSFRADGLWRALALTLAVIVFPVMSVAYIKIYRRLQALQVQPEDPDQAQQQASNTLNAEKYRRTASAMVWVYVLFLVCYVPFLCFGLVIVSLGDTAFTACLSEFGYTFVLLNSFLNPFVYCLRLPDVRTEVMKQLQRLRCQSFLQ